VDMPALALGAAGTQGLAIDLDLVAFAHLGADPCARAVDGDPALADQAVGLASRAEAAVADVLVESHPGRAWRGARSLADRPCGGTRQAGAARLRDFHDGS